MKGYAYILASRKGGTLYAGVTSDLPRRIWEHRQGLIAGFTARRGRFCDQQKDRHLFSPAKNWGKVILEISFSCYFLHDCFDYSINSLSFAIISRCDKIYTTIPKHLD